MTDVTSAAAPVLQAPDADPLGWLAASAPTISARLLDTGAVLVRGLPASSPADLAAARAALGVQPFVSTEAFGHRSELAQGVLSPIRWPAGRELCPYQEEAFGTIVPGTVLTACVRPPDSGGEALLSDAHALLAHLPEHLRDRLSTQGWLMTRSFHGYFGMTWQDAFGVADRERLTEVLAAQGIDHAWLPDDVLRTRRRRTAILRHPSTGLECWFNQIAFLNNGSLEPRERALLTEAFGDDLPVDSAFGDGTPLSPHDLSALHAAYDATTTAIAWQSGDLLVTDNIRTALGRAPHSGDPAFLVALGDPVDRRAHEQFPSEEDRP
ncbi:hypothetical protein ABH926_007778 [Catenulispora sp. GP43]|uniref:TauD/TfdA family dioxygenase n=1 Tax=Catenulispora sp. GP43 TaxID=3156263 RepID=UPI0035194381